jgi:hypothetical protein
VNDANSLARLEAIIDHSEVAPRLEALLRVGVRQRQLCMRTLLLGILLALADGRPAHLTRVHRALVTLPEEDCLRLGVVAGRSRPHLLTYRQVEYTFRLLVTALKGDQGGANVLAEFTDALLEATIGAQLKDGTRALAVDWTDVETFARAPLEKGGWTKDPDASWGHRRGDGPGQADEKFFGYFLQLATMVNEDGGAEVPELVRRLLLSSCGDDPPPAFVPVMERLARSGVALGDVLADSGYSHRIAEHWSLPLRALGAEMVMDLHPHDRGTQGTFGGAICFNGNLYCPSTPEGLFKVGPLARGASAEEICAHDIKTAELARYKFGRVSSDDADGYGRVACPAVLAKVRCPKRPSSMPLSLSRPEIVAPPEIPPKCCEQVTLTVPPKVNAKTRQKHDYPSQAHRISYGRRSAAERANSTVKDPASNDVSRGWCRLMGLEAMTVMLTCLFVVRNQRVLASFETRQAENERRAKAGLEPKTRRRRRKSISDLVAASSNSPP